MQDLCYATEVYSQLWVEHIYDGMPGNIEDTFGWRTSNESIEENFLGEKLGMIVTSNPYREDSKPQSWQWSEVKAYPWK